MFHLEIIISFTARKRQRQNGWWGLALITFAGAVKPSNILSELNKEIDVNHQVRRNLSQAAWTISHLTRKTKIIISNGPRGGVHGRLLMRPFKTLELSAGLLSFDDPFHGSKDCRCLQ
jgi:hypothetical protein